MGALHPCRSQEGNTGVWPNRRSSHSTIGSRTARLRRSRSRSSNSNPVKFGAVRTIGVRYLLSKPTVVHYPQTKLELSSPPQSNLHQGQDRHMKHVGTTERWEFRLTRKAAR